MVFAAEAAPVMRVLVCMALLLPGVLWARVSPPPIPAAYLPVAMLRADKVEVRDVSEPARAGKSYLAGTLFAQPAANICATLFDFAAYPHYMPNTSKVDIVETDGTRTTIDVTLALPLGKIKRYRLQMVGVTSASGCMLRWSLLPRAEIPPSEAIVDTVGSWYLSAHPDDKSKTVVQYFVYTDPGPVPLGFGWIVDALGKESLPKSIDALRARARETQR